MHESADIIKLKRRWTSDLVIAIVMALNRGESIRPLLEECPDVKDCPIDRELDLRGIDLSFQNLRGPWIVSGSGRQRAGAALAGSDLSHANLNWTILIRADLNNARLTGADMRDCDLILADCSGADFTDAVMQNTWLLDTNFKNAVITREQLKMRRNVGQLDFDIHAYEL